ncbi:hypothetical protein E5Q_00842 [Mixia osmundae IAM 14324]|uniref:Actin-like ATPase domain-containing protein n=1 Tax=Mixia osmundae (strain CBS 9802 / IAM 14324 / JCM 22182 / KY 12970) TaxID=764103 RepID=G7DUD4_MIXOS|nr:hypothetical protein E5Q_00842 [Mixia osmundae IAM 14324]
MSVRGKEDLYLILDISPSHISAGLGLGDVLQRPRHTIKLLAGLPTDLPSWTWQDLLVGQALDDAMSSDSTLTLIRPFEHILEPDSAPRQTAGMTAEQASLTALEAILQHLMFGLLSMPARPLGYHLIVLPPAGLPYSYSEGITRLVFERLYLPALAIYERPLAQLYALGYTSGLAVDIDATGTEINVVLDNQVQPQARVRCPIGSDDCDRYLADLLLRADPQLPALLAPDGEVSPGGIQAALLAIVSSLKDQDAIKFASELLDLNHVAPGMSEAVQSAAVTEGTEEGEFDIARLVAQGKVDALVRGKTSGEATPSTEDVVSVPHPLRPDGPEISIGPIRHRYAEPLFDPSLIINDGPSASTGQSLSLQEAAALSVSSLEAPMRPSAWDIVCVTGPPSRIPGVASAVIKAASQYLIDPESGSDTQARVARLGKIPDYFSEMKDHPDLAAYLGGAILAKITFSANVGAYLSKQDYNLKGPAIVKLLDPVN